MTIAVLEQFVSLMVKFDYCSRSIPQYLSAIFRQQALIWMTIDQTLRDYRRLLISGAERNSGEAHRVLAITQSMLKAARNLPTFISGASQVFLFRIAVIQWFFLLRSDESIGSDPSKGLTPSGFSLNDTARTVTITRGVTKTNIEGLLCRRTHSYVCDPSVQQTFF